MQKKDVTPEIRREVIEATGLCTNPNCVAHDRLVASIWEYKAAAVDQVTIEMTEMGASVVALGLRADGKAL